MVRVGIQRNSSLEPFQEYSAITHIVKHSMYERKSGINDIALLHLATPLNYSSFVLPVCLAPRDKKLSELTGNCYAIGLGALGSKQPGPDELRYVKLPVMDTEECQKFPTTNMDYKLISTQICAGFKQGGKDTCQVRCMIRDTCCCVV